MTTPDGSWLSMFMDRNGDQDLDDGLGGWLRASMSGNEVTVTWEEAGEDQVLPAVVEKYRLTRIA